MMKAIYTGAILVSSLLYSYNVLQIGDIIKQRGQYSTFFEEHYVSPAEVILTFPEKKKNLIVLYLESVETTMMSRDNLGSWEYSTMPELEKLALDNINFSNTDLLGGAKPIFGSTWTMGALVSHTAGIPLKIPIDGNSYLNTGSFLAGAYTLGDILKEQEYNLMFMFGSDATFGGRYQYFKTHGDYDIVDLKSVIAQGRMLEEDYVFWGFEDSKLFQWAKEELLTLATQDEPFNFNLLTVNTHFEDGWLEPGAETNYPTQYENVHAYSSKQIYDFIEWIKLQEFYKDTSIVLVGDHNSMQSAPFYEGKLEQGFERVTYNAFINSFNTPVKVKNRLFSSMDLFPTILSSMGVEIEGSRLGLGVDLYSSEPTLLEQYGAQFVNEELSKESNYYNAILLQDDYIQLKKQATATDE